ncbi:Ribosomal protein S18 acetylase RimI [Ekhidna lutea]|uniref:Ribosomal protein S18 acetylase RimI n=1 Tax=Ekhidna lutea TaxID=447679 RepID=A0A239JPM2_EKHLU|nr:GNAT family N-acetyltransferase [Ekhidna lutea]SNT06734.1 Ribosomal protein S18 acetylase RimI [Ekhidna lutea]
MSSLFFRRAEIVDIPILNKISVQSKKHWGYPDDWIAHWMDDLQLSEDDFKQQRILLIEVDNEISGFCSIVNYKMSSEILHLWLLPRYIGSGYGTKLLEQTIDQLVPENNEIIVEADPNAESFYFRHGFVTIDQKASYPHGRFLPVMKRLARSNKSV